MTRSTFWFLMPAATIRSVRPASAGCHASIPATACSYPIPLSRERSLSTGTTGQPLRQAPRAGDCHTASQPGERVQENLEGRLSGNARTADPLALIVLFRRVRFPARVIRIRNHGAGRRTGQATAHLAGVYRSDGINPNGTATRGSPPSTGPATRSRSNGGSANKSSRAPGNSRARCWS